MKTYPGSSFSPHLPVPIPVPVPVLHLAMVVVATYAVNRLPALVVTVVAFVVSVWSLLLQLLSSGHSKRVS